MKVAQIVLLLVVSCVVGTALAWAVFFAGAWALGQLSYGIHSDAAFAFFIALPVGWVGSFRLLYRRFVAR